jgi:hypothetical protein
MKNILDNLSSPAWWVSVVIVGVIVSAIGSLLKDYIGRVLAAVSSKWRNKRHLKKEAYKNRVKCLTESSEFREITRFEIIRNLIVSLIFMALSILGFVLASFLVGLGKVPGILGVIFFAPAAVSFTCGFSKISMTYDSYDALIEAEKELTDKDNT